MLTKNRQNLLNYAKEKKIFPSSSKKNTKIWKILHQEEGLKSVGYKTLKEAADHLWIKFLLRETVGEPKRYNKYFQPKSHTHKYMVAIAKSTGLSFSLRKSKPSNPGGYYNNKKGLIRLFYFKKTETFWVTTSFCHELAHHLQANLYNNKFTWTTPEYLKYEWEAEDLAKHLFKRFFPRHSTVKKKDFKAINKMCNSYCKPRDICWLGHWFTKGAWD